MKGAAIASSRITPSSDNPNTATGLARNSLAMRENGVSTPRSSGDAAGMTLIAAQILQPLPSDSRTRGSSTEYRMSTSRLITMKIVTITSR